MEVCQISSCLGSVEGVYYNSQLVNRTTTTMISNPANPFINGSDRSPFTYEPGAHPYHLCFVESGLTRHYTLNCIVFATDAEHARTIYKDMLRHLIEGDEAYIEYQMNKEYPPHENTFNRIRETVAGYKKMLDRIDEVSVEYFERVQTNHPIKVGWASNDTFV